MERDQPADFFAARDAALRAGLVAPFAFAPGRATLTVEAGPDGPARVVLVGGEPFGEDIVM